MKAKVYNLKGKSVGEINLSDEIFGYPWNPDLVHQALMAQTTNRRQSIANAKDRSEVKGGGRKPWRQKGTGRARHGSIRSPIWKGGGVTHGPRSEQEYAKKLNKKMLRAALHSALSKRLSDGEVKFVDSLETSGHKTSELAAKIKALLDGGQSALLVPSKSPELVHRASKNIPRIKSIRPDSLNVEDLLKFKAVVIEKEAVEAIK